MHKELEKKLIIAMGKNDGPKFIALMKEFEISDIEISDYWVSIPVNQIANISVLQERLSELSIVGRNFPVNIKDKTLRIDIQSADLDHIYERRMFESSCLAIDCINAIIRFSENANKLAASLVGLLVFQNMQENKISSKKNVVSKITPGFFNSPFTLFIEEHRGRHPVIQKAYDENFGIVLK